MTISSKGAHLGLYDIEKSFGRYRALERVSLQVEAGQVLALLGPSGCGKTTLLKIIAGLESADGGEVLLNGAGIMELPTHRRDMGMLFQNYALLPHLDALSNVAFGLEMRRLPRAQVKAAALAALARVKLDALAHRMPREMSGGQQQRVALARAIAYEPKLLLLDEPLAALDKNLREGMQIELRTLSKQLDLTTILVTHDQEEAMTMADRIAIMRAGRIEQLGTPREVYNLPVNQFVASFMGSSNIIALDAASLQSVGEVVHARTAAGHLIAARLHPNSTDIPANPALVLRPEHVSLHRNPPSADGGVNMIAARLKQLLFQGQRSTAILTCDDGQEITVACPSSTDLSGLSEGEVLWLSWTTAQALILGAE